MIIAKAIRRRTLILLLLVLLGALLISMSLSGLQLHAGLPFPGSRNEIDVSELPEGFYPFEPFVESQAPGWLKIFPLLLLSICIYLMVKEDGIRRSVFGVLALSLFIWLIAVIFNWLIGGVLDGKQTVDGISVPPQEAPTNTFPVEPIGGAPQTFVWFVIIALVFLFMAVGLWVYLSVSRDVTTKDLIKAEAQNALKEIREGKELSNVVIRCYMQMVHALETERDIKREDSMTTQEFEKLLISYGYPERAVILLTALFEKVRYGNKFIDSQDEIKAVECLTAIIGRVGQ